MSPVRLVALVAALVTAGTALALFLLRSPPGATPPATASDFETSEEAPQPPEPEKSADPDREAEAVTLPGR